MKWLLRALLVVLIASPALGQQTGNIVGKVTLEDGSALPGVSVQATSNVLPQPRNTVTGANGDFRLPLLPPGKYELTFTLQGMATVKRPASVVLRQDTMVNATLSIAGVTGAATVVATATLLDTESSALKAAVDEQVIKALPVGQEYRDLVKLVPGVQYTEDSVRGPSAGGSGCLGHDVAEDVERRPLDPICLVEVAGDHALTHPGLDHFGEHAWISAGPRLQAGGAEDVLVQGTDQLRA